MERRIVVFAGNYCREERKDYYYSLAYETGRLLAKNGFVTVTGGGPGLMNEASKGAFEKGGQTVGVCLRVSGRKQSEYLSKSYFYHSLVPRQKKLLSLGDGFIALPGGLGTMYEVFAVLCLKRKMEISPKQPMILIDSYYQEFANLLGKLKQEGFVTNIIDSLYTLVDTPKKALEQLQKSF